MFNKGDRVIVKDTSHFSNSIKKYFKGTVSEVTEYGIEIMFDKCPFEQYLFKEDFDSIEIIN